MCQVCNGYIQRLVVLYDVFDRKQCNRLRSETQYETDILRSLGLGTDGLLWNRLTNETRCRNELDG
jgi:hypothetical protein